jgi:hypothetical protein
MYPEFNSPPRAVREHARRLTCTWRVAPGVFAAVLAAVTLLALTGCASVTSKTYFAAANLDAKDPTVTLYRVSVNARSANSKSSLITGFYDTSALRSLYGEVAKPTTPSTGTTDLGTYQVEFRGGQWQMANPAQLYTLVYGPDSKSIGQLIKSYAENSVMGAQFGSLLAAASNPEAARISAALAQDEKSAQQARRALSDEVTSLAATLDPTALATASPDDVLLKLVATAQAIANTMGSTTTFKTTTAADGMTEVRAFLTAERSRSP